MLSSGPAHGSQQWDLLRAPEKTSGCPRRGGGPTPRLLLPPQATWHHLRGTAPRSLRKGRPGVCWAPVDQARAVIFMVPVGAFWGHVGSLRVLQPGVSRVPREVPGTGCALVSPPCRGTTHTASRQEAPLAQGEGRPGICARQGLPLLHTLPKLQSRLRESRGPPQTSSFSSRDSFPSHLEAHHP